MHPAPKNGAESAETRRSPSRSELLRTLSRRSEPRIIAFAVMSFLGALSLSYYCLTGLDHAGASAGPATNDSPVYDARAVPREEDESQAPATRAGTVSVAMERETAAAGDTASDPDNSEKRPARSPVTDARDTASSKAAPALAPLYSFPELEAANRHAALMPISSLAGSAVAAQTNAAGIYAPDAEFGALAPVPEPGAWSLVGAAALALCIGERLLARRRPAAITVSRSVREASRSRK